MNATVVLFAGLALYLLGYILYARFLANKVFKLDPEAPVPSKTMEGGIDYVPTNRYVLFGHHFSSIAGAAPIVGPALAVIWGWVPALLWVVLGAVLMGCEENSRVTRSRFRKVLPFPPKRRTRVGTPKISEATMRSSAKTARPTSSPNSASDRTWPGPSWD